MTEAANANLLGQLPQPDVMLEALRGIIGNEGLPVAAGKDGAVQVFRALALAPL